MVSINVPTVPAGILLQNTYDKVDSNNLKPLLSVCLKIGPPITSTLVLLSLPQTMYVMTVTNANFSKLLEEAILSPPNVEGDMWKCFLYSTHSISLIILHKRFPDHSPSYNSLLKKLKSEFTIIPIIK